MRCSGSRGGPPKIGVTFAVVLFGRSGAPGAIRTPDPQIRSLRKWLFITAAYLFLAVTTSLGMGVVLNNIQTFQ